MSAPPAGDRMRRVLAMVPWIVANPGVRVAEVAARFGVNEKDLLSDLEVVYMVGLPPYSPDSLIEVVYEGDRVWINYADFFARPLRLTPAQGLALLASTDALLSMTGTEPDGPLARALQKLATSLGVTSEESVDVDLGSGEPGLIELLRSAASEGTEVEIDYYSYGRDGHSTRTIAPWRVLASEGAWYVEAWCHRAADERIFRVDRIEAARRTGQRSERRPDDGGLGTQVFHPRRDDPRITLRLDPDAAWVADTYPCESVAVDAKGRVTATIVVTAVPWLERLLVRLGPSVELLDTAQLPAAGELAATAARRILDRYQD